jgi:hypothetical protein
MTEENICLSGGAKGADLAWGEVASKHGHKVIHYSFENHKTKAPKETLFVLNNDLLLAADPHLVRANQTLKRSWPVRWASTANLLRRNYYQITNSEALYAVSTLDEDGKVAGGTAWAIEMYLNLHGPDKLYLFDQEQNKWLFHSALGWHSCKPFGIFGPPPAPNGIWTGIGTRDLNENGMIAIESVFSS